ncbi:uncharacterized protein LOC112465815 [Temnothorax curvispinosus]|uniref:Uncharacterized protein LOC112465815 n=1 Tax=Temnothorax curvispinosus TaxID=300111 RepID=A0A6J1R569_9HYME|nr:uncharacterized protein LOC112465815 [Temnothorax curvispinosus]
MALVKSCFLPFEDLRPGALATLEADRENSTMRGHGSNETMHHLRFDRRVFCAVREKRRWKNLSCHSSPERKKKSMQPMSLPNGNEERFENDLANAPQNMIRPPICTAHLQLSYNDIDNDVVYATKKRASHENTSTTDGTERQLLITLIER